VFRVSRPDAYAAPEGGSSVTVSQREMENEEPDVVNNLREDDESSSDEVRNYYCTAIYRDQRTLLNFVVLYDVTIGI
jgi:hypothetical protein